MWSEITSLSLAGILAGFIIGGGAGVVFLFIKNRRLALILFGATFTFAIAISSIIKHNFPTLTILPAFYYPSVGISFFISQIVLYLTYYKYEVSGLKDKTQIHYSYLFLNGKSSFESKIRSLKNDENSKSREEDSINVLRDRDLNYLKSMVLNNSQPNNSLSNYGNGAIFYFLENFITNGFEPGTAHYTLREANTATNALEVRLSKRKNPSPGTIPLDVKNLVQKSLDENFKPQIYSRNKKYHYQTENKSITKGIYDDYVTVCLASNKGKPFYSLCIDVKGEAACERLHELVDSGEFMNLVLVISKIFGTLAKEEKNILYPDFVDLNNE